jgi:hypothetical protein
MRRLAIHDQSGSEKPKEGIKGYEEREGRRARSESHSDRTDEEDNSRYSVRSRSGRHGDAYASAYERTATPRTAARDIDEEADRADAAPVNAPDEVDPDAEGWVTPPTAPVDFGDPVAEAVFPPSRRSPLALRRRS